VKRKKEKVSAMRDVDVSRVKLMCVKCFAVRRKMKRYDRYRCVCGMLVCRVCALVCVCVYCWSGWLELSRR
jgi:hypothetical protein